MENLKDLLNEELKDLYSAEKQIVKALPKMVKGAESPELKTALSEHLEVTKAQVTRLEEVFAAAGQKAQAKHCKGMEGLLAEGAECLESEDAGPLRDLQLIGAAQRVEHYEVAAYGTARTIAEHCELPDCVDLLAQTLQEEEDADATLSEVADGIYGTLEDDSEEASDEDSELGERNVPEERMSEVGAGTMRRSAGKALPQTASKKRAG